MTDLPPISLHDVERARERIAGLATTTPLKRSLELSEQLGRDVLLKLEMAQATGAFKLRGAANALLSLSPEERRRGVITMSSGNHGRALAYAAAQLEVPAVVCVSEQVPAVKVEAIRRCGAEVRVEGPDQDVATEAARRLATARGLHYVSPFDDADVIAGQGTIALEILEQCPGVDTLLLPLSGGGLAGGIAIAAKALRPDLKLYGVSQALGPAMYESLRAGRIVEVVEEPSLADALQGGLPRDNRFTFAICRELIDDVFLVDEQQIGRAMAEGLVRHRLVLEGGAAVGLAALADPRVEPHLGSVVVAVLTGDNVDTGRLLGIAQDYLAQR